MRCRGTSVRIVLTMMAQSTDAKGALPYQTIQSLCEAGNIHNALLENIKPASLDLRMSDEVYRVEGTFLPRPGESVRDAMDRVEKSSHDVANPMERNVVYVVRLIERVSLPIGVYGYCNPKSSTGRTNVHVRVLADGVPRYDALTPAGWTGELWVSIIPKSFPVRIPEGESLVQLRLFTGDTRFSEKGLTHELRESGLLWTHTGRKLTYDDIKISDRDGSVLLTVDLENEVVGWECFGVNNVLDFSKRNHYKPEEFFRAVETRDGRLHLHKGGFYILSTNEYVRVPPQFACEMAPMDERSGEFRSHRAGYIDPGWGWGKKGEEHGRPLTLEIEPFEDLIVRHKQPISRIKFERMVEIPKVSYDTMTSHYTGNVPHDSQSTSSSHD